MDTTDLTAHTSRFVEFESGGKSIYVRGASVFAVEEQNASKTIIHGNGSQVTVDLNVVLVASELEASVRHENPIPRR